MRTCPQCASACDEAHKFCPTCGFPIGKVTPGGDDPLIGRTLPGGYVILELVGVGGMGRVYRAEQTTLGRTVAVKIVHPHLVGEENAAARFITEARAASRLNHPNSVAIIDFGKTPDGQLYLVMEFLRGKDLARVTYEEGPLSFRRIVDILRQVLGALEEAHHYGIIHRDLKPENIILEQMRSGADFVKVVDFGLAKMRGENQASSITSPGIVCGTPEYMSPEQGRGDVLDPRSDLYSVGVIFFQLLTGHLPFEGDSPTQVVLAHLTRPAPDPRVVAPERQIPVPIAEVVARSLSKSADDRFVDAEAFASELGEALAQIEDRVSRHSIPGSLTRCGTCGALNPTTQKFCGECGTAATSTALSTLAPSEGSGSRPSSNAPTRSSSVAAALAPTDPPPPPRMVDDPSPGRVIVEKGRIKFPLPLIGRDEELRWLDERHADATTSLVGARIVGEVGIGKTRLLREFLALLSTRGEVFVDTGPDPAWAETGYYALRRAVRTLASLPDAGGHTRDWVGASPDARHGLSMIFAHASSHEGPSANSEGVSPEERRFAAAEALRWALSRASDDAAGKCVVLAIDDLHNVDGASRNAFADVVGEPPLTPVLVVATYVPGFDPGWSGSVAAARVLSGLPTSIVTKMFAQAQAPSTPSLDASRTIAPLYLEHLLRFTREQGGAAPSRIADLIALRVERLPTDARRVLQAVAVWGDHATDDAVAKLLPDDTDLIEALGFLRRAGMLELHEGGFRTTHPLLREVALNTIPAGVRKSLHNAALEVCEGMFTPIEVRAMHQFHAANPFQALVLLERVSSEAAARGDATGTILALRRGLELARREIFRGELDDPMRAVLIFSRKLGEALAKHGAFTDAEGVLREALDIAGPSGPDRARVLAALTHVAMGRDRRKEAQSYLREALELATRAGSRELMTSLELLKRALAS